ncbi:alpha/beta fold hydrolase [Jatrophihabitans sp. DSM 45814]
MPDKPRFAIPPQCTSTSVFTHHRTSRVVSGPDTETETESEDGKAQGVLLIHGQPGSPVIWSRVSPLLQSRGLRVIPFDRPANSRDGDESVDQFSTALILAGLLEDQQDSPVVVVGHSIGAGTALALAATAPERVRALVLIAPAAGSSSVTFTDRALAAPVMGPALTWLGFRSGGLALQIPKLRQLVLVRRAGISPTAAREVARQLARGSLWRSFLTEQRQLVAGARRLQERLNEIHCPVVIVAGQRDRVAGPRMAAALDRGLPASAVITTATGHFIPRDDPDIVLRAVLRAMAWEYRKSLSVKSHQPS